MRVFDQALPEPLVTRARRAISRLGSERFRESYFTTFWLARSARPAHALEEAVLALWRRVGIDCAGAEWWLGRAYTTRLPVGFHFDEDVKGRARRHPLLSSVLFFNQVRGGQLAVTDQVAGRRGPRPSRATRLETVAPRRNRYAIFRGDLLHGVLDARGQTPGRHDVEASVAGRGEGRRTLAGPPGRLRITLVVNYWAKRPTGVPAWSESGRYRALGRR